MPTIFLYTIKFSRLDTKLLVWDLGGGQNEVRWGFMLKFWVGAYLCGGQRVVVGGGVPMQSKVCIWSPIVRLYKR